MRFLAIDVETANARYRSICQIGVVLFEDGREVACDRRLVDPGEAFGPWQTRIHGLTEADVAGHPRFPQQIDWLKSWANGVDVVSHSAFDRSALGQACEHHDVWLPACSWYDSAYLALATWPEIGRYGMGLKEMASHLGISFRHHDALEDARAAGQIVARAIAETGLSLEQLCKRQVNWGRVPTGTGSVKRVGDGTGALVGQTIVFTGDLSISRVHTADLAAEAGGNVAAGVSKKITMLVVGEREVMPGWQEKSTKHRRAEELIEQGWPIRIVCESDFMALAAIRD